MNRVTIKDIAKVVGVASQNVSGVLNNNPNCRVSAAKREKILQTARELGYCKNVSAQILRGGDTHTIAILLASQITRIYDEYLNRIIMQLISDFNSQHYSCFLQEAWDPQHDSLQEIKELYSRGVKNFIIIGNIPYVPLLEKFFQQTNCSYIQYGLQFHRNGNFYLDQAVREMWTNFSDAERDNFKIITNPHLESNNRVDALKQLPDWEKLIFQSTLVSYQQEDRLPLYLKCGYDDTQALLHKFPQTKVIFYHSDSYLLGGIKYCVDHQIVIGRDVQLIGVNYSNAIRFSPFPLQSFSYPETDFVDFIFSEIKKHEPIQARFEMKLEKNLTMREKVNVW